MKRMAPQVYELKEVSLCMQAQETGDSACRACFHGVYPLVPRDPYHLTFTWVGALHFKSSGAFGVFPFAFQTHLQFPQEQEQLHIRQ